MKIFSVLAVGAAMMLASCAKSPYADAKRAPSPEVTGAGVYFNAAQTAGLAKIDLGADDTEFTFDVYRSTVDATALDVNLSLTGDGASLFTAPAKVTIPANENKTEVVVTFDTADFEAGEYYDLLIAVAADGTPYGTTEFTISAGLIPWGPVGIAKYFPGAFGASFGGLEEFVYTRYQKADGIELYRLVNAYMPSMIGAVEGEGGEPNVYEGYPMGFSAIWAEELLPGDHYLIIDATDPAKVTIAYQSIGVDWGYGGSMGIVSSGAGTKVGNTITVEATFDIGDGRGNPGTEVIILDGPFDPDGDDKEITWSEAGSGLYSSGFLSETAGENISGAMSVEYAPNFVSGVADVRILNAYPTLDAKNSYSGNDYSIIFQVDLATLEPIKGSVMTEAIGIYQTVAGTDKDGKPTSTNYPVYIENATITRDGLYSYNITADFFTLDMVTGEKVEDLGTFTDTFFWNNQPAKFVLTWEDAGEATFVDGLFPTLADIALYLEDPDSTYEYVAADWTWTVNVEKAKGAEIYRIANPYAAMGEAGLADVIDDECYIVLDATSGEVFVDFQYTGVDAGNGEIGIGSSSLFGDATPWGTIEDGVIDFGGMAFEDDERLSMIGYPMTLTLPAK
jgi:hypothetical protein